MNETDEGRRAVMRLALEHRAQLWGFLVGLAKDPLRAEDLFQNTYLILCEKWDQFQPGTVNCKNCSDIAATEQPIKVGSFKPNPFGLYDMGGGVDQWVEDCWHKNYQGAPTDGSAWVESRCASHVIRSGSWRNDARYVRPSNRDSYDTDVRYPTHGFRVALSP